VKPFAFARPATVTEAARLLAAAQGGARAIAGGSDLLAELKEGTAHYDSLISLSAIPALAEVREQDGGLRLGAMLTLAQVESERRLTGPWRILAEAARGVATPEIRNQGTLGGNLCQRPRCLHFRSPWLDCLKKTGSGCPALESEHQHYLSIFGGRGCHAVHASDLAPPLLALGAAVEIATPGDQQVIPLADFLAAPAGDARSENALPVGGILIAVLLPPVPPAWKGVYLKARERTAGDFPLVSVAFGCAGEAGAIRGARLVLGGVAAAPRRCQDAEALMEGQRPTGELAARAARAAFAAATPLPHNGFKLDLGLALVARAIVELTGIKPEANRSN